MKIDLKLTALRWLKAKAISAFVYRCAGNVA